jgi:hypothetical protein
MRQPVVPWTSCGPLSKLSARMGWVSDVGYAVHGGAALQAWWEGLRGVLQMVRLWAAGWVDALCGAQESGFAAGSLCASRQCHVGNTILRMSL